MSKIILTAVLLALFLVNPAKAEKGEVLKGIDGIRVFVYTSEDAEKASLTESLIRTDVELLLRQYGIPVLTQEEYKTKGAALVIEVRAYYEYSVSGKVQGFYSIVDVDLKEFSYLARNISNPKEKSYLMTTWDTSMSMTGSTNNLKARNIDVVNRLTKSFINSYLAANPKS